MIKTEWNEVQLKALLKEAQHWLNIYNKKETDKGRKNSPCCAKFYDKIRKINDDDYFCTGCPISIVSGKEFCINTPYEEWCLYEDIGIPDPLKFEELVRKQYTFVMKVVLGEIKKNTAGEIYND